MFTQLFNFIVTTLLVIAGIWFLLAIGGIKLKWLRRVRHAYTSFWWKFTSTIFNWLWRGQGHSGAAHMASPPRLTSKDDDQW